MNKRNRDFKDPAECQQITFYYDIDVITLIEITKCLLLKSESISYDVILLPVDSIVHKTEEHYKRTVKTSNVKNIDN